MDNPIPVDVDEYHDVFDATQTVLREYRFDVERKDRRFGVVSSAPLIASSIAEPWYADNTTLAQTAENTLTHQRRTVRVTIEPTDSPQAASPSGYQLRTEVVIERRHLPPRQLTTAAVGGLDFERNNRRLHFARTERGEQLPFWRPVGRDPRLEQRLIRDILIETNRRRSDAAAPAGSSPAADRVPAAGRTDPAE